MDHSLSYHWTTPYILDKYAQKGTWEKRFTSEKYFFEKVGFSGMSVLDIGCASGGLYHALLERFGTVDYTGIDVSEPLLQRGKELSPDGTFLLGDCVRDPDLVTPHSFDIVVATGVFQHEPAYKTLFHRMFTYVADGGHVLFDLKLFHTHHTICDINVAYGDHGDHRDYFIVLNKNDLYSLYTDELTAGSSIEIYGYYAGMHPVFVLPQDVKEDVCSAHVLIKKEAKQQSYTTISATLPASFMLS